MRAASFKHSLLSVDIVCMSLYVAGWLCISASFRLNILETEGDVIVGIHERSRECYP